MEELCSLNNGKDDVDVNAQTFKEIFAKPNQHIDFGNDESYFNGIIIIINLI